MFQTGAEGTEGEAGEVFGGVEVEDEVTGAEVAVVLFTATTCCEG